MLPNPTTCRLRLRRARLAGAAWGIALLVVAAARTSVATPPAAGGPPGQAPPVTGVAPTEPAPSQAPATVAPGSCLQCHGALTKQPVVHLPAAKDCSTCHKQQGREHRFTLPATGAQLCTTCHQLLTPADKFIHGPVAAGECLVCHDPHGSPNAKLARVEGSRLCQRCHLEMEALLAEARFSHPPARENCARCHSPHGSPFRYQLRAEGSTLCFNCHKDIQTTVNTSAVKHEAVQLDRQCLNCHDPHAADQRPQLRAVTMSLCLGCHDKEQQAPSGMLLNMKAWLSKNPDAHGPIRQKDCAACHRPHGSERYRLLRQDYPPKFYSAFDPKNYALCFTCHQPDLVRVERTTAITGFRNGDRNLHFVHVNRPEKGRTCRACHEVHASTKPRHIRESTPFGAWLMPINYEQNDNGGRCAPGCHVPREYSRAPETPGKVPSNDSGAP